jgi:hypothetical protein
MSVGANSSAYPMRILMKSRWVVYPFLIATYPFVMHYAQNCHDIPPGEMLIPIGLVLAGTLICWGIMRLITRDRDWAGLVTLLTVCLFFDLEKAASRLNNSLLYLSTFWVAHEFHVWAWLAMLLETCVFTAVGIAGWRWIKDANRCSAFFNVFAIVLLAFPIHGIVRVRSQIPVEAAHARGALAVLPKTEARPDIYYIILDGFARADVLKQLFDTDLEPFLGRLESRGFVIAREARTNYCQTPLSLSSSLNGAYHKEAENDEAAAMLPDPILFRENAVMESLRPLGYKFVTFATGFDFTEYPFSDVYLTPFAQLSAFHRLLLDSTPIHSLFPPPGMRDSYTLTRERTNYLCEMLPKVAKMNEPTFTFAHILAPHPPFVFGADGEDVSPHDIRYYLTDGSLFRGYYGGENEYVQGYRGQVAYLTKAVERAIEGILANSPEPPIIVLQSDHGSGLHLSVTSAEETDHHERMSILNAFYLPGKKSAGMHQTMTPVNTFRMIFNNYFGAQLPYLAEECYYSSWPAPQRFTRVTDQVGRRPTTSVGLARASGGQ